MEGVPHTENKKRRASEPKLDKDLKTGKHDLINLVPRSVGTMEKNGNGGNRVRPQAPQCPGEAFELCSVRNEKPQSFEQGGCLIRCVFGEIMNLLGHGK